MTNDRSVLLVGNFLSQHVGVRGVCEELAERLRTESELRLAQQRFTATFNQAAVGMAHTSIDRSRTSCQASIVSARIWRFCTPRRGTWWHMVQDRLQV